MPKKAKSTNIPFWRVRVYMRGGGVIHLLSRIEPVVTLANGKIKNVAMDIFTDSTQYGETLGFIDWSEVAAVGLIRLYYPKAAISSDPTDPY